MASLPLEVQQRTFPTFSRGVIVDLVPTTDTRVKIVDPGDSPLSLEVQ